MTSSTSSTIRLGVLTLGALLGPACSSQMNDRPDTGGQGGLLNVDGGHTGSLGGAGGQGGTAGATTTGCAASGESCEASRCCQVNYEMCLPQGNGHLCLHADLPPDYGGACNGPAASTLPDVSLIFPDDRCSYTLAQAAAGITMKYQIVVQQDLASIHPQPKDAGRCQQPGPSGLIVGFSISGGDASYCLCDVGACPAQTLTSAPRAGTYDATIPWDGRRWGGPSDTQRPEGAPFPPGTYTLTLTSTGTRASGEAYELSATRHITITP